MGSILSNLKSTVIAGLILTVIIFVGVRLMAGGDFSIDHAWGAFLMRWFHVVNGVMWIGLLWYFNFVQIPNMPNIPDEQKPAIGKVIAPAALFWFRWSAMGTIVFGVILAAQNGYLMQALGLGITDGGASTVIGIGMWLGIIMWFNVWFVIWPNQKKALGMVEATPEVKDASARTAMLFCMVAAQNGGLM